MRIILEIPDSVAESLRAFVGPDIGRAAIERFALEGYKASKLSRYDVQRLLGFDNRWDTEEWLGKNGAEWQYSLEDLEADRRTIERVMGAR